jgi:hypothetical protein
MYSKPMCLITSSTSLLSEISAAFCFQPPAEMILKVGQGLIPSRASSSQSCGRPLPIQFNSLLWVSILEDGKLVCRVRPINSIHFLDLGNQRNRGFLSTKGANQQKIQRTYSWESFRLICLKSYSDIVALHVERIMAIDVCHVFLTTSRIGSCIPILSKMERSMIHVIGVMVDLSKFVLVMGSMCHTSFPIYEQIFSTDSH